MLAGLQSETDSLFPALKGILPDAADLEAGAQKLKSGKTVRIAGYKTEIFDLHDAKSRASYTKRMYDLSNRVQIGTIRILVHDRQVLSRKDGSTGWFVHLEWMEYELPTEEEEK